MADFDVAVIGSGPGGYVAAIRAAQRGATVGVFEREHVGGACLNWGCIPTKTLIASAELFHKIEHAKEFGIDVGKAKVDMEAMVARKNKVIKNLRGGISSLFKANKITLVQGEATLPAPDRVVCDGKTYTCNKVIIATGSSPARIPGLETNGKNVVTARHALELKKLPKRIAVIGAGPIGGEFACIWNAFGAEVTLIEMMPEVFPLDDEELGKELHKIFRQRGIDVRTGTKTSEVKATGKGVHLELEGKKAGSLDVDLVLVGIGNQFNTGVVPDPKGLGLELGPRGQIAVNEKMETSLPGVYAIGDVTGKTMLAHGASFEGLVAAANATDGNKKMDYRVLPWCSFTSPELAHVGLTEKAAREAGIDVKVGRFSYRALGRAMAMGVTDGMVKIVGDAKTDEVVGVHILGAEAGELIASASVAMSMEATVEEIAHTVHTHPTLSEAMMEAAENYLGMGIHSVPGMK